MVVAKALEREREEEKVRANSWLKLSEGLVELTL